MTREEKLKRAAEMLHEADALVQEAVEDMKLCYEIHNRLNDLAEDIENA